jgi:hypothetical protein
MGVLSFAEYEVHMVFARLFSVAAQVIELSLFLAAAAALTAGMMHLH